jgi:hypothetical protein
MAKARPEKHDDGGARKAGSSGSNKAKPASGRAASAPAKLPATKVSAKMSPPGRVSKPQGAFPKKNQPPTAAAFAARLPLALGKRFDQARSFLLKHRGVREDVFFYGPESGWALRYLHEGRPLCSLHIHDEQPIGILSIDASAAAGIDWKGLSPIGHRARKQAHGSPSLLWLDIPLEGTGASDFKMVLRAKLASVGAVGQGSGRSSDIS